MYIRRYISEDATASASTSAFRYVPKDSREYQEKGEINALITVIGNQGFSADRITKFVWDGIIDSYLYTKSASTIELLKKAVSDGSKKAIELVKNGQDSGEIDMSFAVCVFKDKTVYIGVFGEQQVFLFKNGGITRVSSIITKNKGVVASIAISDDDIVLVSSPGLLDAFTASMEEGLTPKELVNSLDYFSSSLSNHQSLLLITRKDLGVVKELHNEVQTPVFTPEEDVKEVRSNEIVENENISDISAPMPVEIHKDRAVKKIKLQPIIDRAKIISSNIWKKINPVVDKLSFFFTNLFTKISGNFGNKYGRSMWYRRIMAKLSMFKVRKGSGAIGVKIDGYKQSNTRNKRIAILILVIILTILLWGAIRLSIQAKEARELHKQVVAILDPVQNDVYRAEGLVTSDPTTVATILFESKQKISQIENLTLSVDDAKQLADIKKKMQEIDDRISGRINVSEENNKLSRVIDGRTAYGDKTVFSDMVYYKDDTQNEYLFVTDRGNGAVYKILIDEKKAEKIEDKDKLLSSPMYVDYGNFGVYVYDSDSGMLKASLSNGKTGSFVELSGVGTDELQDSTITDLGIFTATDNIYLVDTKQGAVLKAVKTGSGYGLPSAYITDNAFSTGSDIFSDYSIYVLTLGSDGLHRYSFSNGAMREKPLSIVGLTEDFTDLTAGCTNGTLNDTLFVFDNGQKRILAFEKPKESGADILHPGEIHLLNQYVYRGSIDGVFSEVKEIAVNAKEAEMYILDGNTIWKMQLGNE